MSVAYSPYDPVVMADPFPYYERLRAEDPIYHYADHNTWVLSRYDHVLASLRDWPTYSSDSSRNGRMGDMAGRFLIFSDPPDHTTLRRLVNRPFTPRAIAELEPRVREIAEELVTELLEANEEGRAD